MLRGLYAMIVVFKYKVPDQQQGLLGELSSSIGQAFFSKEKLDIDQTVEEYSNPVPTKPKFKQGLDSVRLVSGKTHEDLELPDAAALMYPDLNRVAAQAVRCEEDMGTASGKNRLQEKFQGAGERVSDYMNRRAQVIYETEHPGASLSVSASAENFAPLKSRLDDPNHPANSGH